MTVGAYRHKVVPVWAKLELDPPVPPPQLRTQAQLRGIRYERLAQEELQSRYGCEYVPNPWFRFRTPGSSDRLCSADGLLIQPALGRITIVEIKIKHVADAWFQVSNLYQPVVDMVFNGRRPSPGIIGVPDLGPLHWEISICEVVKWYDGTIPFPQTVRLRTDVHLARPHEWAVHIFNPPGFAGQHGLGNRLAPTPAP